MTDSLVVHSLSAAKPIRDRTHFVSVAPHLLAIMLSSSTVDLFNETLKRDTSPIMLTGSVVLPTSVLRVSASASADDTAALFSGKSFPRRGGICAC